ncbi:hypothetical protein EDD90_0269 [Streptomyces sp. Ag109_O5-1]|uniref:hypothetical protein n=1 Tax=Streptomyces sp. Ag109_O5-1 TaxID=1938851 RepID=UPI000F4F417D|nr:hypothetical protein [Streptomyces sp. Ag109_O5-1]RPE37430.1 hypothetical protein EDD90_0269 [Streptomyces sp. Ag109_O5-1]
MTDLLSEVLEAHGGLQRWNRFTAVTATIVSDGELFAGKGLPQDLQPRRMTVALHEEHASVSPFGAPGQHTDFTAGRIAIERADGTVVAERLDPRKAFTGHTRETPWDPLDRAYFNGYALWTYLTTPFFAVMKGMGVEEADPWDESPTERWRHLRVTFPDDIASHSTAQDFYFGDDGLLRRHDYHVDIAGGFAAAQYVHDIEEADGIKFPTRRRAYLRRPDGRPDHDHVMVGIDLSDVHYA